MKSKGLNPNGDFSSVSKTFRNIWYSIFHMVRWFKILLWCIWTFWKFDLSFRKFFILQTYSFLLKITISLFLRRIFNTSNFSLGKFSRILPLFLYDEKAESLSLLLINSLYKLETMKESTSLYIAAQKIAYNQCSLYS